MSGTIPPIPPLFETSSGNPDSPNVNRVDTMPTITDPINITTTKNVSQSVADENLPQLLDSRGGLETQVQAAPISGSLFIHQSSSHDQEDQEGDAFESLSGHRFMPDDDLASMTGFETQDSADHVSKEVDQGAIKSFVTESIAEELPQVEAQKELSQSLHNKMKKSISLKDLIIMFKDMISLLEAAEVFKKANAEGEKWEKNNPEAPVEEQDAQHPDQTKGEQDSGAITVAIIQKEQPSTQVVPNARQTPPINEEKALVLHTLEENSLEEDTSGKKEADDEPLAKKLRVETSRATREKLGFGSIKSSNEPSLNELELKLEPKLQLVYLSSSSFTYKARLGSQA
nr:hypothetical protein [Tanacetum cinerariifolium]